jgi:DNA polymerase III subunit gamma/tau
VALDTKHRPLTYDGVLGQASTVQILRQYVKTGSGFHQSYLFAGPWGSGKTTLGRILARSLLCSAPVEGVACDACLSCQSILIGGSSENFFEIDAATNSGKDSIRKIVEEIQYATFSGKRRIYLFDESHRLTLDALDALLKPMEDCVPGTQDKTLVCVFCTTEPEKMRATILSRCAPAFVIKPVTPDQIAERLAAVCDMEGIPYEKDALKLIGELTECHIRDALKAIEGVSMLGQVNRLNVAKYLHLDSHLTVLEILSMLFDDLPGALRKTSELLASTSPTTCYEALAEMAMLAYRAGLGAGTAPSYLDAQVVQELGTRAGAHLLSYASRLSSRPGRPTASMLLCDLAQLHQEAVSPTVQVLPQIAPKPPTSVQRGNVKAEDQPREVDHVWVHPRAVKPNDELAKPQPPANPHGLPPLEFFKLVKRRADELKAQRDGRTGQDDLGGPGANQGGGAEGD